MSISDNKPIKDPDHRACIVTLIRGYGLKDVLKEIISYCNWTSSIIKHDMKLIEGVNNLIGEED